MEAAARIASINFAIAFASYIKGNRGQLISITVMAELATLQRALASHTSALTTLLTGLTSPPTPLVSELSGER